MKVVIPLILLFISFFSNSTEQAEQIFHQLAPSLYQIRLIDNASGEKSSIGSGFQVSEDGLIATNYHVISGFAQHPNKYHLEYIDHLGNKAPLVLKSVDVINDLALVKRENSSNMAFFQIAEQSPSKGEEIYSLGNPHDLGMIVVPGTYNGLKSESFNDRIHFTGSVNPGMSGGPVVNSNSEVVGINVATSGNQIGFLVPHSKLQTLLTNYQQKPPQSIEAQISTQLINNQKQLISTLLASPWLEKPLGNGIISTIDVPYIRCWGESNADKADAVALLVVANCALEENTYITSDFFTSSIDIEFKYMQSKKLSDLKFYHLYQQHIVNAGPGNRAGKNDVSEFQCHHDLVKPSTKNIDTKAIFCTRAYKKFPQLFDVLFLSASIDKGDQALISHFTLAGVSQDSAMVFTKKFMESVSWK
jgi:serine protease Do